MFMASALITYKDNFTLTLLYKRQNVIGGHYATVNGWLYAVFWCDRPARSCTYLQR
jgi:hypothetical protein